MSDFTQKPLGSKEVAESGNVGLSGTGKKSELGTSAAANLQGSRGMREITRGNKLAARMWEGSPGSEIDDSNLNRSYQSEHEAICYCIQGKVEFVCNGISKQIKQGDTWVVPANTPHTYKITEGPFKAIEVLNHK